jgi:hypothetical protein
MYGMESCKVISKQQIFAALNYIIKIVNKEIKKEKSTKTGPCGTSETIEK